jgi:hypothetical protein
MGYVLVDDASSGVRDDGTYPKHRQLHNEAWCNGNTGALGASVPRSSRGASTIGRGDVMRYHCLDLAVRQDDGSHPSISPDKLSSGNEPWGRRSEGGLIPCKD